MCCCLVSRLFPAQLSCVSWEDILSLSCWAISRQPRASYLRLCHGPPCVLTRSLTVPDARGETSQAGAPHLPRCSIEKDWPWGAALRGGRVQCLSCPAEQSPGLGRAHPFFIYPNSPPKEGCCGVVGLVDETHCCVAHWVLWGGWWGCARPSLACPAPGALCSCAPPDVFQSSGGSWFQSFLLKHWIVGFSSMWHKPV